MTIELTDEQIAQEWVDAVEAHRPNMITTVTEFARSIAALVAEQKPGDAQMRAYAYNADRRQIDDLIEKNDSLIAELKNLRDVRDKERERKEALIDEVAELNERLIKAEQHPATVLPDITDEEVEAAHTGLLPWNKYDENYQQACRWAATRVRDSLAARMRAATPADVLPGFPNLGEGTWELDNDVEDNGVLPRLCYVGKHSGHGWRFVPADPDADVKKALAKAAWDCENPTAAAVALDELRDAGFDIVRRAD